MQAMSGRCTVHLALGLQPLETADSWEKSCPRRMEHCGTLQNRGLHPLHRPRTNTLTHCGEVSVLLFSEGNLHTSFYSCDYVATFSKAPLINC